MQRATARLVNFHLRQPLTQAWGQGLTSSSDAQVYAVPVRALNATFHPKYFASAGRGIAVYTHVSDLWIPFYTQVITCHVRQGAVHSRRVAAPHDTFATGGALHGHPRLYGFDIWRDPPTRTIDSEIRIKHGP